MSNQNNNGVNQDVMIVTKSCTRKTNSSGNDMTTLRLDPQQSEAFINELVRSLEESPTRGVRIDLHVTPKVNKATGNQFDSGIMFVRGVAEPSSFAQGARPAAQQQQQQAQTIPTPAGAVAAAPARASYQRPVNTSASRVSRLTNQGGNNSNNGQQ